MDIYSHMDIWVKFGVSVITDFMVKRSNERKIFRKCTVKAQNSKFPCVQY